MQTDCIILVGGLGTRLQSVLYNKPKCMADINGKPFIYYLFNQLKKQKFNKYIFAVGYQKDIVIEYIKSNYNEKKYHIEIAEEFEPLGTGGAIINALKHSVSKHFFVINGDTYFDIDFEQMLKTHLQNHADCTIALKEMKNADRYGIVKINEQHKITSFEEKKVNVSGSINGGIYCINRISFNEIKFPLVFSFEKDYMEKYLKQYTILGFKQNKYFIDIGIPVDYEKAQTELLKYL